MRSLPLAFLWHMHQPFYRNMATGECSQPWVRLHAIHSYYDMMKLYQEFEHQSATINFVPALLLQLKEYVEYQATDAFLEVSLVPARDLIPQQKVFLLRNFFMANAERMIMPYKRYAELFMRRGENIHAVNVDESIRYFSWQDYLDLQVSYNLTWFGFKSLEKIPHLKSLWSQDHFSEEDKAFVLDAQREIMAELMTLIRQAPRNLELSTTPAFHPILPLLMDTEVARRSQPNAFLPRKFSDPKLAAFHVKRGIDIFREFTGRSPFGLWPAEGSVSPEVVPLLADAGIRWFATDEEILKRSERSDGISPDPHRLYRVEHDGRELAAVFRDRGLSDLLGFSYARMPAHKAVDDFIGRLSAIADLRGDDHDALVCVILDGENPWEHYEQAGGPFLTRLFSRLEELRMPTTTISRHVVEHPPRSTITRIHSGSWINADYAIWIGKGQKNQAWDYLRRTREELGLLFEQVLLQPDKSTPEALLALESFAAASGSDWFWWFDDDFASECKSDFDKIFRTHLENSFSLLGRDIPPFLLRPIYRYEDARAGICRPPSFIWPTLDGMNTSFFEWTNALVFEVGKRTGTMGQSEDLLRTISFGFNATQFFLRFDPLTREQGFSLGPEEEVILFIHDHGARYKLRFYFDGTSYQLVPVVSKAQGYNDCARALRWAVGSILEIGFDTSLLGYHPGDEITLAVTVVQHGIEVRRYSHIVFQIPDETYERQMWVV